MFAYCENGPVTTNDKCGESKNSLIVQVADIAKQSHQKDDEIAFMEYCANNNIKTYSSAYACAEAWAKENRPLSKNKERMSYIYEVYGHYFYTDVYVGTGDWWFIQANVVAPTLYLQMKQYWVPTYSVAAQIHSHPAVPEGMHCDFPSMDKGIAGGDRLAYTLFKYPEMFIVPYSTCTGEEMIIRITDPSTWCPYHPYK